MPHLRILFFTPHQIWPANSGARLRNFYLATSLARRCSVTLVQILQPDEAIVEPANSQLFDQVITARKSRSYTAGKLIKGLTGPLPLTVLNYSSPDVTQRLSTLLAAKPFDIVQLESSHLFSYLEIFRSLPDPPAVLLDWHNIESELMYRYASETPGLAKKLVARRTAGLLRQVEGQLLQRCDAHAVVSDREKSNLAEREPRARIEVIPNGVDTTAYNSPSIFNQVKKTLLFVGSMDYHANIDAVSWFVGDIWPGIARQAPDFTFVVAGRSPSRQVQELASDRVQITGTVEDVRPFYSDALAVVVPLRVGGGTRLKILEAMAMGVPVISTRLGAEGISATDGQNILLADSAEETIASVTKLVRDPILRERLAREGRRLVTEEFDWNSIGERLYASHLQLLEARVTQ